MNKIEQYKDTLKEYEGKELTTKYLIESLGITSYYIGVLTRDNVLTKIERGKYQVTKLKNDTKLVMNDIDNDSKKRKPLFEKFSDLILEGKYYQAYHTLVKIAEYQKDNHNFDNHYRIYFTLLTHLLKLKGIKISDPYDYDNNLLYFHEEASSEYFADYTSFRDHILVNNFLEAKESLDRYASKETIHHNGNKISTTLFKKMLDDIVLMENNKKITSSKLNQMYYYIRTKDYDKALSILKETEPLFNTNKSKEAANDLIVLCQTIIDFKKDETLVLPDLSKNVYDFKGDESVRKIFNTYMQNKDYYRAVSYVDKCAETYKGIYYSIASLLLEEVINLNKSRNPINTRNEVQKRRITSKKDDGIATMHFSNFLGAMQKLDFDLAYKEIQENLVYATRKNTPLFRRALNMYILLNQLISMQESKLPLEDVEFIYFTSDSDHFNLNLALKREDFKSARIFLDKLDKGNSLSLEAYDLLLKAIFRQDKINRGIKLTHEDELKPLSSHLKKDMESKLISHDIEDVPQQENLCLEETSVPSQMEESILPEMSANIQEEKTLELTNDYEEEVLASIKNLTLNYQTLYSLIKNREFEEAFALIKREEENGYSIENLESEVKETPIQEEKECVEEISKQEEVLEENKEVEIPIEIKPPELTEREKHQQEVLESIKDLELNYDNLYDLVYNQEYEKALTLLEREIKPNEKTSRLYFNARRLISQYFHIINGTFKEAEKRPIDYTQDCFKVFFASLNNRDYDLASEVVDECIDRAREKGEMQLFKLILEDIVKEQNKIIEEKLAKEEEKRKIADGNRQIEEINKKLYALSNKHEFDDHDVKECHKLLDKKVDISVSIKAKHNKDLLVLGASEAAMLALINGLNDSFFADAKGTDIDDEEIKVCIETNSNKPADLFYDALKNGDYLSAEKILSSNQWDIFRDKINGTNLRLLKNLFLYMKEHMSFVKEENLEDNLLRQKVSQEELMQTEKEAYKLLSEEDKNTYNKIDLLKKVYSLIKHQNYQEALGMIIDSDVHIGEDEFFTDLLGEILLAKEGIKEESHYLFDEFNKALDEHDIKAATTNLTAYSGYLTSKSINRDITYHRKRIDILEKDLKTPNFEEKEKLYSKALEMFYNKREFNNLQKAIELLDQYISLDNDINNKGYVLRARAYEKLKKEKEAKADYKKALTIAPDPISFFSLGKYAYEVGDYERAINYLEKFHAIRPFKSTDASRMLATSYNSIGQKEKSVPFNRHLEHMSYVKTYKK